MKWWYIVKLPILILNLIFIHWLWARWFSLCHRYWFCELYDKADNQSRLLQHHICNIWIMKHKSGKNLILSTTTKNMWNVDPRLRTEGKLKTYQRVLLASLGKKYLGNFLLSKQYKQFVSQAMGNQVFTNNFVMCPDHSRVWRWTLFVY